jgi:hypothetical protein
VQLHKIKVSWVEEVHSSHKIREDGPSTAPDLPMSQIKHQNTPKYVFGYFGRGGVVVSWINELATTY